MRAETIAAFSDPWFWVTVVTLSGWWFFIYIDARHWWRIPRELRSRISNVLNRPIEIEEGRAVVFTHRDRFLEVACEVTFESLAEREVVSRGVPPEVFGIRRGGKDFEA